MRLILSIDPGPEQSGFVVWDGKRVHEASAATDNDALLKVLHTTPASDVVLEQIASYGMAVGASVFETCVWTGRFLQVAVSRGRVVDRLPRMHVKMHLCHDSRATGTNIRQALLDRFGPGGTKKHPGTLYGVTSHAWAALALAVTYYDQQHAAS